MSEFTYGNIIRAEDKLTLFKYLSTGTPYMHLNQNWVAFFTDGDGEQRSSDIVETISMHCPILYFYNLEDHCWGYEILYQGELMSYLHFSYGLEEELAFDITQERYPDMERITIYEEIIAELENPEVMEREIRKHFESVDVHDFKLFGVGEETVEGLKQLLRAETYLDGQIDAVDRFKEMLNINEMSWIRYERTENRNNIQFV